MSLGLNIRKFLKDKEEDNLSNILESNNIVNFYHNQKPKFNFGENYLNNLPQTSQLSPLEQLYSDIETERRKSLESDKERMERMQRQSAFGDILSGLGTILIGQPQSPSDKYASDQRKFSAFKKYQDTLSQLNNLPYETAKLKLDQALKEYGVDEDTRGYATKRELDKAYQESLYGPEGIQRGFKTFETEEGIRANQEKLNQQKKYMESIYGAGGVKEEEAKGARPFLAQWKDVHFHPVSQKKDGDLIYLNRYQFMDILNRIKRDKDVPIEDRDRALRNYQLGFEKMNRLEVDELVSRLWNRYYGIDKNEKIVGKESFNTNLPENDDPDEEYKRK